MIFSRVILRKNLQTMVPKNAIEEINDRAMEIYWNFFSVKIILVHYCYSYFGGKECD